MIQLSRILTVLLVAFTLASCENDLAKVEKIASNEASLPVETSRDINIIYSDSARVKAQLSSPLLKFYKVANPYHEMPSGLKVDFYGEDLKIESTLTAKSGRKFQNQGIIEVKDSVVVINEKGERLNTERLIWNEKTRKIYTDKFVKITTPNEVIYGEGMEANQNFTNYKIFKIKGIINVKDDPDAGVPVGPQ
jgi:LPS export ABC transporter protein LptC